MGTRSVAPRGSYCAAIVNVVFARDSAQDDT